MDEQTDDASSLLHTVMLMTGSLKIQMRDGPALRYHCHRPQEGAQMGRRRHLGHRVRRRAVGPERQEHHRRLVQLRALQHACGEHGTGAPRQRAPNQYEAQRLQYQPARLRQCLQWLQPLALRRRREQRPRQWHGERLGRQLWVAS